MCILYLYFCIQAPDNQPDEGLRETFDINGEMLPSHIPTRVAQKILFVGESVQMFEADNQLHRHLHNKGMAFSGLVFLFLNHFLQL